MTVCYRCFQNLTEPYWELSFTGDSEIKMFCSAECAYCYLQEEAIASPSDL